MLQIWSGSETRCRVTLTEADILALKHKSSLSAGWEQLESDSVYTGLEIILKLATIQTPSVHFSSIRLPEAVGE